MNYSERRFRAALRAIPDGTYHGEDAVDDDGLDDPPLVVKAAVTIKGEQIAVDYAGTCGQVRRNLNCPWASTVSATLAAIKSALTSPDIPFNEGFKRPIAVTAPKGTLVNPNYPAPVRARLLPAYRCFNAVLKALAQVVPDQVDRGRQRFHACARHLASRAHGLSGLPGDLRWRLWRRAAARRLRWRRQPALQLHQHAGRGDRHGLRAFPRHRLRAAAGHGRTRQAQGRPGPVPPLPHPEGRHQLRHLHRSCPACALRAVRRRRRQPHAHRDRARRPGDQAQEQGSRRSQEPATF